MTCVTCGTEYTFGNHSCFACNRELKRKLDAAEERMKRIACEVRDIGINDCDGPTESTLLRIAAELEAKL